MRAQRALHSGVARARPSRGRGRRRMPSERARPRGSGTRLRIQSARRFAAALERLQRLAQVLASASSHPRSSDASRRSREAVGLEGAPPAERYATSRDLLGRERRAQGRAGGRRTRLRERAHETREQPMAMDRRMPVVAAVEDGRQDARASRPRPRSSRARSCSDIRCTHARARSASARPPSRQTRGRGGGKTRRRAEAARRTRRTDGC